MISENYDLYLTQLSHDECVQLAKGASNLLACEIVEKGTACVFLDRPMYSRNSYSHLLYTECLSALFRVHPDIVVVSPFDTPENGMVYRYYNSKSKYDREGVPVKSFIKKRLEFSKVILLAKFVDINGLYHCFDDTMPYLADDGKAEFIAVSLFDPIYRINRGFRVDVSVSPSGFIEY